MQSICLKFFCSGTVVFDFSQPNTSKIEKVREIWGLKKKIFTYAVERTFIHNTDTCLKRSTRKMFLKSFCCETVTLELFQTNITKNERIRAL